MSESEPFAGRRLYLVCDSGFDDVEGALRNGVDVVQLRDRGLGDRALLAYARRMVAIAHSAGALMVVNDRPDIALLSGADGVHVGQDDITPAEIRELAGDRLLIGQSTHSEAQIAAAMHAGVDYIGVGPVHATPTKPGRTATGLELVAAARRLARVPWFAIGGIDAANAAG
ncbi:MAG: thiamine phosphate synthase, partial [Solirubrobacterales bacterium]